VAYHSQTPQYACSYGMTSAELDERVAQLASQQYRPTQICAYADSAGTRYLGMWTRDLRCSLTSFSTSMTAADYQKEFDALDEQGYKLLCVTGDASRYTALWEDGVWQGFAARHGLSFAEFQDEFDTRRADGYSLIWVGGQSTGSTSSYAGIWSRFADPDRHARHQLPIEQYQDVFDSYKADGYRIAHFNAHRVGSQTYVSAIWVKAKDGYDPDARHNLTECEFKNELQRYAWNDYRPICINAYLVAGGTRYAGIWTKNARTSVVQGRSGAGLTAFETGMQSLMSASQITAASLAVAHKGNLVLAKGFGDVTDDEEPVPPTALFRVASVSKAFCGTAIVKLIEDGKLSFDDKLLDLLGWTGPVKDPALTSVTVDHLLHHLGGWDLVTSTLDDPLLSDQDIAADLDIPLPVTQESIFRWTTTTRKLDWTPGTREAYSNYGFMLLGMIVERVTGQDYEDFVRDSLLAPLGIRRMRLSRSLLPERLPGEVMYHEPHTGMYPNVLVPGAPHEVMQMYGSLNFINHGSSGGWAASAVDLVKFASAFDDPAACPILSASSVDTLFNRVLPNAPDYVCGWEIHKVGNLTEWFKTGNMDGSSALMYRRSDGVSVGVTLNRTTREPYLAACKDDTRTPAGQPIPAWDTVELVRDWVDSVSSWPSVDLWSDYL
jgi:CubicO group peptidase (beta-lactamase class C family)